MWLHDEKPSKNKKLKLWKLFDSYLLDKLLINFIRHPDRLILGRIHHLYFQPMNMCTFLAPRSRNLISTDLSFVPPMQLAALRAACLGWGPVKTLLSVPSLFLKITFFVSAICISIFLQS